MEGKNFVPNNTSADLMQSWHIPRPTLARSSSNSSPGSSSTNSTQSARSGSLLLTAANLAQIHADKKTTRDENMRYYIESTAEHRLTLPVTPIKKPIAEHDDVSIASSMHFTVVNVNPGRPVKTKRGFCKKHRLTVLVVSMSVLFTVGIVAAVFYLEMRARRQFHH